MKGRDCPVSPGETCFVKLGSARAFIFSSMALNFILFEVQIQSEGDQG
jgi:hypothetical protein